MAEHEPKTAQSQEGSHGEAGHSEPHCDKIPTTSSPAWPITIAPNNPPPTASTKEEAENHHHESDPRGTAESSPGQPIAYAIGKLPDTDLTGK